ncbi:MAG: hypothetical protein HY584_03050, partial [Candidatus Omnitrophica bacterium]|nr:hypothetical protein [Candidatus Omnitrophota bacterium]
MSVRRNLPPFLLILSLLSLSRIFPPLAQAELENGAAADIVLGQPDFLSATANSGGRSARTVSSPVGVSTDGKRLFLADQGNTRILIWNTFPKTIRQAADVVVGQVDFASTGAPNPPNQRSLNTIVGTFSDGKRLFAADQNNHRVLIWNSVPQTNGAPADVVLGQPGFTTRDHDFPTSGVTPSAHGLHNPSVVFTVRDKLLVVDLSNHRVMIWHKIPTTNFAPADIVVGQPSFGQQTANNGGRSARTLNSPEGVWTDGKKLIISDSGNHRVLIWNKFPTENFAPADVVVGQPDFGSGTVNIGGRSDRTFNAPQAITSTGDKLIVADRSNHRILIWNQIPTKNFEPADYVLGQQSFNTGTANIGGRSAFTLNNPEGVDSNGKTIFVPDVTNQRVLIYNIASSGIKLSPQFEQGKAVLGKVFHDVNGNGVQDQAKSIA